MNFKGKRVIYSIYNSIYFDKMNITSNASHRLLDDNNRILRTGYYIGLGFEADGTDNASTFHVVVDKKTGMTFDVPTNKLIFLDMEDEQNGNK